MSKPQVKWFAYMHKDKGVEITDGCDERLFFFSFEEDISPKSEKIKKCASVIKSTPKTVSTVVATVRRHACMRHLIKEMSDEQKNTKSDSEGSKDN